MSKKIISGIIKVSIMSGAILFAAIIPYLVMTINLSKEASNTGLITRQESDRLSLNETKVEFMNNTATITKVTIAGSSSAIESDELSFTSSITMSETDAAVPSGVSYQWIIKDGTSSSTIPGGNSSTLNVEAKNNWHNKEVLLRVSLNNKTYDSNTIRLSITKRILTQVQISGNTNVKEGEVITITSSLQANSKLPPSGGVDYNWYFKLPNGSNQIIIGKQDKSISLTPTIGMSGRKIYCVASYNGAQKTSNELTINVTSNVVPTITSVSISGNTNVNEGDKLSFSSSITMNIGDVPSGINYQWIIKDQGSGVVTNIPGATSNRLNVSASKEWDGKLLILRATYNGSTVDSAPKFLTINTHQLLIKIAGNTDVLPGESISLTSSVEVNFGEKPEKDQLGYQWYLRDKSNDYQINNQTSSSLTYTPSQSDNGKNIILKVTYKNVEYTSNALQIKFPKAGGNGSYSSTDIWIYVGISLGVLLFIIIITWLLISIFKSGRKKEYEGIDGDLETRIKSPPPPAIVHKGAPPPTPRPVSTEKPGYSASGDSKLVKPEEKTVINPIPIKPGEEDKNIIDQVKPENNTSNRLAPPPNPQVNKELENKNMTNPVKPDNNTNNRLTPPSPQANKEPEDKK